MPFIILAVFLLVILPAARIGRSPVAIEAQYRRDRILGWVTIVSVIAAIAWLLWKGAQ
jgi:hypothetical protein